MVIENSSIRIRHSTRSFLPDPIGEDDLRGIIEAGIAAPSSKNRQPWRIYVLRGDILDRAVRGMDGSIVDQMSDAEDEDFLRDLKSARRTMKAMDGAPVVLAIAYEDRNPYRNASPYIGGMTDRQMVDVLSIGACIENMILEAEERGISSLWIGDFLYGVEELASETGISETVVSLLALGYPESAPAAIRSRRDDLVSWLRSPDHLAGQHHSEAQHHQQSQDALCDAGVRMEAVIRCYIA